MPADGCDTAADLHLHSLFSDGSAAPEAMVEAGLALGLRRVAITDHMPLPFVPRHAMPLARMDEYRNEISRLQRTFRSRIRIERGLELEWLPSQREWILEIASLGWDLRIGSVHGLEHGGVPLMVNGSETEFQEALATLFGGNIARFGGAYFEQLQAMIASGAVDVVGHLDVFKKHNRQGRYFDPQASWYQQRIEQTLALVAECRVAVEINTGGFDHAVGEAYPSLALLPRLKALGIPLVMGSDAHHPGQVGRHFDRVRAAWDETGRQAGRPVRHQAGMT